MIVARSKRRGRDETDAVRIKGMEARVNPRKKVH